MTERHMLELELELFETKKKLNSVYEQLIESNETMQSFNEEMTAANEEMQSTNEEMQSVNIQLDAINLNYQSKNKELLEINDDLNNYFRSNINGQLFIDKELLLMKFSPGTVKLINLLDTDIGRPLSDITTNIRFETLIEDVEQVFINGIVITKEIQTNNGRWYQVMTMPYLRKSAPLNNGAIITFNDITELKKVQLELDISNKLLNMSIDAAELGTFSIQTSTRAFKTSVQLKSILGYYADEELSFENVVERIEDGYRANFINAIEASINHGDKCDFEVPFRHFKDNQLHWLRIIGNLSYSTDRTPSYFTGVFNDITIHKQDEIRKNDFIAMVSHDLKSPLTAIQAYMQLITMKVKKAENDIVSTSITRVNASIKKMNRMINGFLTVAGSAEGQLNLDLETFELSGLINEIVEESRFINPSLNIVFDTCPKLTVVADRDKLGQVINNFLSNAIKYSPRGKPIHFSLTERDGAARVCVKDEGIGIKKQDQDKLFDRYYRVKSMETKNISGFGLGLYLSSEIIKAHQGKIWVESEINEGSSFYFSVPLAPLQ
jgi:two-component system CheB/CheR fusion protein